MTFTVIYYHFRREIRRRTYASKRLSEQAIKRFISHHHPMDYYSWARLKNPAEEITNND